MEADSASHCIVNCLFTLWIPDLQEGKLNKELNFVHHSIRSKLDEFKREEINRLRTLLKARHNLADHKGE